MKVLQLKSSNFNVIDLLKKIEKFKNFSDHEINTCIDAGIFREYEPDEIVIKDGAMDNWVYLLLKGSLSIEKNNQQLSTIRRCGDLFGEMGVIDGSPRSATIRTLSKTVLLCFESSIIEKNLKEGNTNFCYLIFRIFSEVLAVRLRNTTDEVVKLKKENTELKNRLAKFLSVSPKGNIRKDAYVTLQDDKRILIVDAVESTRKILRSIVKDLKFKDIIEAENLNMAIHKLNNETINLIISDSNLANFSVVELLQKVRQDDKLSKIPFIIISSESEAERINSQISPAEPYESIIKPFNANVIHDTINTVLARSL